MQVAEGKYYLVLAEMKMFPFRTFDGELSYITSATGNLLIGAFGRDELEPHLLDETATFLARQYDLSVKTATELKQMIGDPVQVSEDSVPVAGVYYRIFNSQYPGQRLTKVGPYDYMIFVCAEREVQLNWNEAVSYEPQHYDMSRVNTIHGGMRGNPVSEDGQLWRFHADGDKFIIFNKQFSNHRIQSEKEAPRSGIYELFHEPDMKYGLNRGRPQDLWTAAGRLESNQRFTVTNLGDSKVQIIDNKNRKLGMNGFAEQDSDDQVWILQQE